MAELINIETGNIIDFQNLKIGLRYLKYEYGMCFINLSIKINDRFYAVEVNPKVGLVIEDYLIEVVEATEKSCQIRLENKNER